MGGQKKKRHIPTTSHRNKTSQNGTMTASIIEQTNSVSSKDVPNGRSIVKNALFFLIGAVLMALLMPQIQNLINALRNNRSDNSQISHQLEIPKTDKNFSDNEIAVLKKSNETTDENNKKISKELMDFNATFLTKITPKKIFVDGRRIPPVELLPQKPNNSSVKVFLFEEFLSEAECDGLMSAHNKHVHDASNVDPILCFDSVSTLRQHLKEAGKQQVKVTPRDFTPGTTCVNATFSRQLKAWFRQNWSYSTAFYPGENRFSAVFAHRVQQAMGLIESNGGKFQITAYPEGVGENYCCTKLIQDCVVDGHDQRDRVATVLVYLQDVQEGGKTEFPARNLGETKKGRALLWNNMNENGKCEPMSIHNASKVVTGHKYILQRWYYYKSFYSLGKRPPEPELPARESGQSRVSCDEYDHGSCRWYDEWNYDHLIEYQRQKLTLI
ncbi:hypothetical protein ACJMK2_024158 [Sinanodonta woodiana]|uniref:Prolyl 4-hydroxylase alpha subunit domain-containing protein n=1 Tax=Sinanodonta woodiana TaxID=1069815 RepID=A0ABD3T7C8_SINWO